MRAQQFAFFAACRARQGQGIVVARIADRGDAERQQHGTARIVREMHVGVPQPGHQRLAFAIDDLRAGRHAHLRRRSRQSDHALVDDYGLIFREMVAVEKGSHVSEGNRARRRLQQRLPHAGERLASASSWIFCNSGSSASNPLRIQDRLPMLPKNWPESSTQTGIGVFDSPEIA